MALLLWALAAAGISCQYPGGIGRGKKVGARSDDRHLDNWMVFERNAPKGVRVRRTSGTRVEHHRAYDNKCPFCETGSCVLALEDSVVVSPLAKGLLNSGSLDEAATQLSSQLSKQPSSQKGSCRCGETLRPPHCETLNLGLHAALGSGDPLGFLGNFGRLLGLGESAGSESAAFGPGGLGGTTLGAFNSVFFVANTSTSFM